MIMFEKEEVSGWEVAIRGMRNPMNSWDKSDSKHYHDYEATNGTIVSNEDNVVYAIGPNDLKLMGQLANAGSDHAKFRRMIIVTVDVTAPLYWWKEYDTYKVGTVANSCSTMHKIQAKEFELGDFSHEHLSEAMLKQLVTTIHYLNLARKGYNNTNAKEYWWDMIQMLPSAYNQKRTLLLNYEVLSGMWQSRKNHKLDEWRKLCDWISMLPCADEIILNPHRKKTVLYACNQAIETCKKKDCGEACLLTEHIEYAKNFRKEQDCYVESKDGNIY